MGMTQATFDAVAGLFIVFVVAPACWALIWAFCVMVSKWSRK